MWTVTLLMWITVWVPAGGKHDRFHHTTAFSMAFNMVYLVALLAMHHQFSIGLQLANAAIVITMISLMAKSVFVSDKAYIYYQQAYFICFWGAIVLSTYVR
jgi:hypothetical protein